jgi:hypothetical protein
MPYKRRQTERRKAGLRRRGSSRQPAHLRTAHRRRSGFERLEDRCLLAITVNTLVDEADGNIDPQRTGHRVPSTEYRVPSTDYVETGSDQHRAIHSDVGTGSGGVSAFVPPPFVATPTNPVQTVRVIVLNYEPTVPSMGNRTLWDIFGWNDPRELAAGYLADIEEASGGAIDYQIVQWRDLNEFPIFTDGFRYTAEQYVQNRMTNSGWNNSPADFYTIAEQHGLAQLVNDNVIDEIWMFGDHFFNLLGEAWMAGPGSFFINGPSFPDFPVERAVAGFGFNYERGVAEMIHNLGHRTENHGSRGYGGWNIASPVTPWDYFTANVAQTNRTSFGVGSTHYPFNGSTDYDYANPATVSSYADDFVLNFPNQTYAAAPMSRDAWGDLGTGDWHRAYQQWFFGHIPRSDGTAFGGRQNNWFKYIYDFNAYRPNTGLPRDNEAILGAPPITQDVPADYEFTLRYYDVQGIDTTTLDDADVIVEGPIFLTQIPALVEADPAQATTAGTARTVRYRISAPGGSWDAAESGEYTVSLRAGQVRDINGNFLPGAHLGTFQVNVTDTTPIDVAAMLATGAATVQATTWDIGGPAAIFDNSIASLYRTPNIDPALVTLSFTTPQTVTGFRTFYSGGNYRWKIETADTLADLNSQTGTYELLVPLKNTPSDVFSSATLTAPVSVTHLRLTAERLTGDNYVHINTWELLGSSSADTAVPVATLLTPPVTGAGNASTSFSVRYTDDRAVDIRTINFGDIRVTGPNGFLQTAAFYGLDTNANGPTRDAQYFVSAPGGSWDVSENGTYDVELLPQQVFDLAGKPAAPLMLASFVINVLPPETRPKRDLTELNADDWFAAADGASASTSDDTARKTLGAASVRFETTGGFDTYLRYEPAGGAMWDLTAADEFHFDEYAQNPSPFGFQEPPIIRFIDVDGDAMEFRYYRNNSPHVLWNDALGRWLPVSIDIKSTTQPATGWRGTAKGTPDWSRMRTVEIHADTWDAGFTLWFDRMGFNLPVVQGDYNGNQSVDAADYVVWRKTLGSMSDLRADGNANGTVDQADYAVWRSNFGRTAGTGSHLNGTGPITASRIEGAAATAIHLENSRHSVSTAYSVLGTEYTGSYRPVPTPHPPTYDSSHDAALLAWFAARAEIPAHQDHGDNSWIHDRDLRATTQFENIDAALELLDSFEM